MNVETGVEYEAIYISKIRIFEALLSKGLRNEQIILRISNSFTVSTDSVQNTFSGYPKSQL